MATALILFDLPLAGGSGTVGFTLYEADGTEAAARTTTGISEVPASSGRYSANPTLPSDFTEGFFVADDGAGNTYRDVVQSPDYLVDVLLKRDFSDIAGEADRSVLNALRLLINKRSISGTTLTVTKEDDSTPAWTADLVAAPGADPVSSVDPA